MNLKIGKGGAAFLSTMLISVGVFGGINLFTDTPPVANAGIDQIVEMDTVVQFDGSGSVGSNLNYTWYLRTNGDVGYGVNPTHTFTEEGIYEVGLLVRETTSYMMDLDIVKITVRNQNPIADAGQDMIVNEDDEVVFDAGGTLDSEADMATLVYEWDFADGMKGHGISPTHVYTRSGTYPAVLTVTDRWGAVGVDIVTIVVNNPAPAANAGSDKTVNEGEYVYFDGSGSTDTPSDVPTLRYDWNFGDGGSHATHYWKDDGTYPVTLTVTDDDGAESTDNLNVHVRNVDPIVIVDDAYLIADITLRVAGERWHDVEMYLNESGAPREEFYVFREEGDPKEQEDTREKMKLSLGETWTAEVRYTPLDDPISGNILGANPAWIIIEFENGAFRKIQHPFNVARPETWSWNITLNDYFFLVDNKLDIDDWKGNPAIHFDYLVYDPGMDAETVTWTCGDDTVSKHYGADAFPTFIRDSMNYTPKGDMQNITITVEDDDGGSSSTTLGFSDGTLTGLSPKVSAGDDGAAIEDGAVPFSGSARTTVSRAVTGYQWSFGDGQFATGQSAEHAYAFSGTYYALLRAWDDLGNTGMDIVRVDVSNADPVAVAGPDLMGLEDKFVHFDGSGSSDTPTDMNTLIYEWDFGDGTVGYGVSTSHVYSNAGSYTVTLTVMDNDYAASVDTLSVTVSNLAPIALAGPDRTVYGAPMGIEFVGVGLDTFSDISGLTYSWNFGDGTQSAGRITTHTYSAAGTYTVVLTVRDDDNAAATDTCTVKVGIDSDGDNLGDSLEISLGTDPNNWDTDGDHISDYWEIYVYGTDPALSDSDDDGLADWYEIAYLGHDVDVDGDGLMCPWDWDSDGDWIRDGDDPNPLVYNHADGTEATEDEIITVSNQLGASVIIKYDGTSTAKATISETVPPEPLNKPVGPYLSITTSGTGTYAAASTETYTAEIRIRMPDILPDGASEERLALYRWDNAVGKWLIAEKTGVDLVHRYVWAVTSDLYIWPWVVGDSEYQDSDEDGLTDWFERSTFHPIVSYDFESGAQGWTATGGEHLWGLQSGVVHSGSKAWHAGGWYEHGSFLTSPWIDLGIAREPRVSLWHRSGAEGEDVDYTHAKIYIAKGGGEAIEKNLGLLPPSVNAWSQVFFDLSWYEGMTVQLEFYFHGFETSDHRYIDDVRFEGGSNKLVADTDGDEWNDGDEINKYYTNPINPDTDGDGVIDSLDMDPLVDLEITVNILEILALDPVDSNSEADFYVRVTCDRAKAYFLGYPLPGYWKISKSSDVPIKKNADHLTPTDLEDVTFTFNVPDDEEIRTITIDLFDDDGGGYLASGDDWCDISRRPTSGGDSYPANSASDDGRSLILTYNLKTAQWSGDDYPGDPSGYGYASGEEDGSTSTDQDDCAIWFDITQNDYDNDGLTYWQEVHQYGTDPTDPSSPGWVGYYVDTELFSKLQTGSPDLRTYSRRMGEYAGLGTKVISGTWTTPEQVKADIKTNYQNGMVGAVLVGDMPMAFLGSGGGLTSLFYEDMDGPWEDMDGDGIYDLLESNTTSSNAIARQNAPEIFVGLLRPPVSRTNTSGMADVLRNYFYRVFEYIDGEWPDTNRALLVENDISNLDAAKIKLALEQKYLPFGNNGQIMSSHSMYFYGQPKQSVLGALSEYSDIGVIVGHSDWWYVDVNNHWDTSVRELKPRDLVHYRQKARIQVLTCCRTTRYMDDNNAEYVHTLDGIDYYYIAGYFPFGNPDSKRLGVFGYSNVASGGLPGSNGFFESLNNGELLGHSILSWGHSWKTMQYPSGRYHLADGGQGGHNWEHYYLNFIGDPLIRT